ncbi:helix-turn-helix domain-containing protein [Phormidium tenue FACHB-886]|nr:helix-turn-helix domain-containing protein [Phormidium tenue FACHB-886]
MRLDETQAQLLEQFLALPLLSPDDFVARWTLSYRQISQICCCSISTVEHWFSNGAGRRLPTENYQKLLAIADFLLTNSDSIYYWQLWQ